MPFIYQALIRSDFTLANFRNFSQLVPVLKGLFLKFKYCMNPLLEHISVDPNVCFGKPCVKGTRIWVSLLLDFIADGTTFEDILKHYPQLTKEDILACVAYGAAMSKKRSSN
ncbi:MAG: DUF433 domain-containing protein [Saprospiraceae bacterium]|nr:DUF433 domain-containing protein [Saprospiraceae bacterium]